MKKLISNSSWVLILFFCFNSCVKPTHFSEIPKITFKEFHQYKNTAGKDSSLDVVISFQDGDGDIGYSDGEYKKCGVPQNNLFLYYEKKEGNSFIPFLISGALDLYPDRDDSCQVIAHDSTQFHFDYRMPFVQPSGSNKSIDGEISVFMAQNIAAFLLPQGRFRIFLEDRAGNKSNEILSTELDLAK